MRKFHYLFAAFIALIFFLSSCKKEEFLVTFNPNGGKGSIVTQTFTVKVAQPLMANSFTNNGFTFIGWNTKPDGEGTFYKDQERVKISEHLVLYALWKPATGDFTVTFNANGGEGMMEPQKFEAGVPQPLSANRFFYDNYWFVGWCTSPNGKGKHYSNEQSVLIASNITLYAQWQRILHTYFVFFDANGGEGTMKPQAFIEFVYQKLDTNKFKREGFIFKEWNTKADGKGWSFVDNEYQSFNSNLVLYAQWMKIPKPCPGTPTITDSDENNVSGFSALPAGLREYDFSYLGQRACFWSSSTD